MAYRRKFRKLRRFAAPKRKAGAVAKKIARKAYRGALKMNKRKLAKIYATKCGQVAFRVAKRKRR